MGKLDGKVALVTGGSRGIGRAIALALAEEGADVAINYVASEAAAHEVAEAVQKVGRRALLAQADVADYPDTFRMAQHVLQEFGHLDILVNNAGTNIRKRPDMMLEIVGDGFVVGVRAGQIRMLLSIRHLPISTMVAKLGG